MKAAPRGKSMTHVKAIITPEIARQTSWLFKYSRRSKAKSQLKKK